ncbi:hypothetical protein BGX38DRAFT_1102530, partial [Terfezia claveryi]
ETTTVDRQMKWHNVPRFFNKVDPIGANPWKAVGQINNQELRIAAERCSGPHQDEGYLYITRDPVNAIEFDNPDRRQRACGEETENIN